MAQALEALPHVVILGGGFGGLAAAQALRKAPVRVTLVDRQNHHLFQPLLYQVATAVLNPSEIAAPLRALVRPPHAVLMDEVQAIHPERREVELAHGKLSYDYLVVATGASTSFFGNDQWAHYTLGLKTVDEALEVRRRMLLAFEHAERTHDPAERRRLLTFVLVGAGPTGVEMAGSMAEIAKHALKDDFVNIDPGKARIILLEGAPRVLGVYPEELSTSAKQTLLDLGVEVRTGARVTDIDDDGVWLGDEHLQAGLVLWTAGVAASALGRDVGAPLDRAGRVKVEPTLQVPGHPEIFVVGDLASLLQDGKPVPGLAPVALQEGKHAGRTIARLVQGKDIKPFRYFDRGSFAVVGRGSAVGQLFGKVPMAGFLAWVAWLTVHLFFLVGFRNRIVVLVDWAYSFVSFRRSSRLITDLTALLAETSGTRTRELPSGGTTDIPLPSARGGAEKAPSKLEPVTQR